MAFQQALQVMTPDDMPFEWAQSMHNLANAYAKRIHGDRAQNIEEAIAAFQQAIQVRTHDAMPIQWAETVMDLASTYCHRLYGKRSQNFENAIAAYQQALQVITRKIPRLWAFLMMNLANSYRDSIHRDRAQNLEDAIAAYQQVLQVMTKEAEPVDWSQTINNLAIAYAKRICGDRAQNLEDAINAYHQALQVRTRDSMPFEWAQSMSDLAGAYYSRIRGERFQNLEDAINAYNQALEIFKPQLLPNECRRTARLLANVYADEKRWSEALASYEMALEAAEILYQASLSRSSQEAELAETYDLFRRAAYAQARAGNLEAAVVAAEVGRARGLSEALERDRADLTDLETTVPELYQQYQQAAEALRQFEIDERFMSSSVRDSRPPLSQAELRQRVETIRQDFQEAIAAIRQVPGYESFLEQPTFEDIAAALQPDQPLVYFLPTPNGSLALVVHRAHSVGYGLNPVDISPVWINSLTEASLLELLEGSGEELGGWFGAYNNQASNREAWFQAVDEVTQQLWDLLMGSVVTHLNSLGVTQAVLIPTGYLGFLPLHAAWTEDATTPTGRRYALDAITFTYAPNARSLQAARAVGENAAANSLLAINEPRPTTASELLSSEREVEVAIDYFQESHHVLKHERATRDAVLAELPNRDVLHFSCHGYANFASPLDSGLLMANDEILSLRDFFNTDLQGVRLAILSACETGLPGTKLPDEVVSLPTGLLQAGVAGVAASLWSVADLSTMMLLVRFYDYWQNDKLEPAEALRKAQQWVRDTPNGEKEAYFKGFIPELEGTRMPHAAASALYQSLAFSDPNANNVAHPFYWAAFTYVGV